MLQQFIAVQIAKAVLKGLKKFTGDLQDLRFYRYFIRRRLSVMQPDDHH